MILRGWVGAVSNKQTSVTTIMVYTVCPLLLVGIVVAMEEEALPVVKTTRRVRDALNKLPDEEKIAMRSKSEEMADIISEKR